MKESADEVKINANCTEGEVVGAGISNDGAWQKRGFSSLNRTVASLSIGTGKVCVGIVMHVLITINIKILILNDTNSSRNLTNQSVYFNHRGSAPAMEVEGIVAIYNRSILNNSLRYIDFYGDGDTKSFKNIENTYPEMQLR